MATFDLLVEPWIPVSNFDDTVKEVGILEVLLRAHELENIVDPAPPVQFGLYRFLIAFIMDAYGIKELEQVAELIEEGQFEKTIIENYINHEARDRFDLFHPLYPFLQISSKQAEGMATKSVADLFQHLPSGTFATHFHHFKAEEQAFSPAVCARGLTTIAPFMTEGGQGSSPSVNGNPPWYVLVKGKNLFKTIILNCCAIPIPGLDFEEPPAWRSKKQVVAKKKFAVLLF
ncbi:MAG: type I-E CRISPR-associated protein Cse1/CasA [bacterium]